MSEEMLDETLRRMALEATTPPPTPREEIWAGIQAARAGDMLRQRRLRAWGGRLWWGVGIAAVLLVGIGLGRWSAGVGEQRLARADSSAALAYSMTTTQHLSQAEALLTLTRSVAAADGLDAQTIAWAGDLLTTTRLLLDSPAADDPKLRVLLEDLELVLAEIAHLRARPEGTRKSEQELDLVKESIENGGVLPRLRTAIPSGVPVAAS